MTALYPYAGAENVGLLMLSNNSALSLGETVLLTCIGYAIPTVEITWTLNGQPLMNSSLVSIYEEAVLDSGSFLRESFLEICSATSAHTGTYTCTITNTQIDIFASTELTVFGKHLTGYLKIVLIPVLLFCR